MSAIPLEGTALLAIPPLPTEHLTSSWAAVSSTQLRVRTSEGGVSLFEQTGI